MNTSLPSADRSIPAVCRMLRTKTAFGFYEGDDQVEAWELGHSTTAVYWCLSTMQTAGPDEQYAHPDACQCGRVCYKARG